MGKCYASKFLASVKSQVGYKETGKNITKYAKDFDEKYPNFYNGKKQGAEWCDMFFDWNMIQAFGEAEALRLTCQPKKSCGAGCTWSYSYYKAKGQVGKEPKLAAQIFFGKSEKSLTHTGVVVGFDATHVYTIEGNKNNKVSECTYSRNDSNIFGYGYPMFDPESEASKPVKSNTDIAKEVIDGKWGCGNARKENLAKAGYNPTVIQNIVNEMLKPSNLYKVKVVAKSGLNIRSGAGETYKKVGAFGYGTIVTITEVKGDWGRCNKGWICLAFTVRV